MPTILIKNAVLLATFDDQESEFQGGGVYIEDNLITQVDHSDQLPGDADRLIDMTHHLRLPVMPLRCQLETYG